MGTHGIIVEIIEKEFYFIAILLSEEGERILRYVPKRFDIEFGDYISLSFGCKINAFWGKALTDEESETACSINVRLIPFLEITKAGKILENKILVDTVESYRKRMQKERKK